MNYRFNKTGVVMSEDFAKWLNDFIKVYERNEPSISLIVGISAGRGLRHGFATLLKALNDTTRTCQVED